MGHHTAPCSHENLDLATHGLPKEIFSDNGPPFTSREIKQFMKERGINLRHVTPLWSQANDEAEVFMKPLAKAVKAARLERKNWTEELYDFFYPIEQLLTVLRALQHQMCNTCSQADVNMESAFVSNFSTH